MLNCILHLGNPILYYAKIPNGANRNDAKPKRSENLIFSKYHLRIQDASTVYLYRCHNPTTLQKSAFKPKRGYESTTGIHLIDE